MREGEEGREKGSENKEKARERREEEGEEGEEGREKRREGEEGSTRVQHVTPSPAHRPEMEKNTSSRSLTYSSSTNGRPPFPSVVSSPPQCLAKPPSQCRVSPSVLRSGSIGWCGQRYNNNSMVKLLICMYGTRCWRRRVTLPYRPKLKSPSVVHKPLP
ncbi:hypothetical protein Pcinc_035469 [Petrolisthes cinctipes]|uniref:Uncharacterized protein n=1 Tax=Petrolisthes cinctipes TaxID=88211 RepID=A0AAE1BZW0_PETCI|nr:hypothetical protein Pcinc_035469 [Petrolisthes cinctipes]